MSDSINAFVAGANECEEVKRVIERFASKYGCAVIDSAVVPPNICPPLNDLRIWGFDTDDFVPFNSTFNIDAYSNYLLGVGYDNIMQCYTLRNQLPSISRLETIALQVRADKERSALPYAAVPTALLQQPRMSHPASLASLKQPPFYRPPG